MKAYVYVELESDDTELLLRALKGVADVSFGAALIPLGVGVLQYQMIDPKNQVESAAQAFLRQLDEIDNPDHVQS